MNTGEYHNYKMNVNRLKDTDRVADFRQKIKDVYDIDPSSYMIIRCYDAKVIQIFQNQQTIKQMQSYNKGIILLIELPKELNPSLPPITQVSKVDSNYGIDSEWVKIPIHYHKTQYMQLPRFMWAKKSWNLKELHQRFYNEHKDLFYRWLKETSEEGYSDKCKSKPSYKNPNGSGTIDYSSFLELSME